MNAYLVANYRQNIEVTYNDLQKLPVNQDFEETNKPLTLVEIKKTFDYYLNLKEIKPLLGSKKFTIEMFLPLSLINEPVDTWKYSSRYNQKRSIGIDCKVVVRSSERLDSWYREIWKEKWNRLPLHSPAPLSDSSFVSINGDENSLDRELKQLSKPDVIGLKLEKIPNKKKDIEKIFCEILVKNTPIVLWFRKHTAWNEQDQIDKINCELNACIYRRCIYALADTIFNIRAGTIPECCNSDLANHISLLWEDPYRVPPPINYTMEKE